jgi:4-hydroxy-tetrahydrodipicolinate synthase
MLPEGLIAPNLTPFNDDLSIAEDLCVAHARRLIDEGCVGLAPFGTTGEALSVGIDERKRTLESLVSGGIDPACLIPGAGLTNLTDTASLVSHAMGVGCLAVMVLPPFFYKDPEDDGIVEYFARLIGSVGPDVRIVLYHIPQVAGVGFRPELVATLKSRFPRQVVGIKDSSGDWTNTEQLYRIDDLAVYPGSELPLLDALDLGGPGCVSATANTNAPAIVRVIEAHRAGDPEVTRMHDSVKATRLTLQRYGPIPAQKYLLAKRTGDERWLNLRPPLLRVKGDIPI